MNLSRWAALPLAVVVAGCADPATTANPVEAGGPPQVSPPNPAITAALPLPPAPPSGGPGATTTSHDFTDARFTGSQACGFCHDGIKDKAGEDVSIRADWAPTMMANSARDPLWQAKAQAELLDNPELAEDIGDTCSRCHTPMANETLRKAGIAPRLDGPQSLLNPSHPQFEAAMDGVSCTLCHQIRDTPALGTPAGATGGFAIGEDRRIYGPYPDPFDGPMRNRVGYEPEHSAHVKSSALCGSCHDVRTPVYDFSATPPRETQAHFPEQMIYSEWKHSEHAREGTTCQDCHLPKRSDVVISTRPPWFDKARADFGKHEFVGANAFMLELMGDHRALLGITAGGFDTAAARARAMLATAATVTIESVQVSPTLARFDVRVANRAGHKVPTGFPSRRAWLHVRVETADGAVVFESGRPRSDGSIEGVDADESKGRFEPHRDLVRTPAEVPVYEAVAHDGAGRVTYGLLRSATWAKDNRLLPNGFDPATAPADVRPRGAAATDPDFSAGGDRVSYAIEDLGAGPFVIRARLLYQTVGYAFAHDLFRHQDVPEIDRMRYLWERAKSRYEVVATAEPVTQAGRASPTK